MTYEELIDFIEVRLQTSHIYQPVLIRTLVDAGGTGDGDQTRALL